MLVDILVAITLFPLLIKGQCSGTTTITSNAQATSLGECGVFDGDIEIDQDAASEISINGLSLITGDLYCRSGNELRSLSVDDLVTIGQKLTIRSNDVLSSVSFASLQNVDNLDLYDLPNMTDAGWNSEIPNVTDVRIARTGFTELSWLTAEHMERLEIEDNSSLNNVSLSVSSSEYTSFESNGPALQVSLPNLELVYNLTVSNCRDFYVPSLANVNRSAAFIGNTFQELSIPNLLSLGSTLMFWNNTALSNLNLPLLVNVSGDVLFHSNPLLSTIEFPRISVVEGDISINDSVASISMPALTDVQGDVNIYSSSALDCAPLDPYDVSDVFKGLYVCTGNESGADSTSPTSEVPPDSGSTASSLSGGAKGGIAAGAIVGSILLVLGAWLLWRRRKATKTLSESTKQGPNGNLTTDPQHPAELDLSHPKGGVRAELDDDKRRLELDASDEHQSGPTELPEAKNDGRFELDGPPPSNSTVNRAELSG